MCIYFIFALCVTLVRSVQGHGMLIEPPSRASMWRYGYDTPVNYADNQLFCGGYTVQWEQNDGKCGVCGDPWEGPRDHEAGGKYATGIIVRHYKPGATIHVIIDLTATHKGWFEFRICPNNDPNKAITHECLDQHVLQLANGTGTKFPITSPNPQKYQIPLKLPPELQCSQCVLQWKYNAGNNWGVDDNGPSGCVGCGPQEQFYACADIAIGESKHVTSPLPKPAPTSLPDMVQRWMTGSEENLAATAKEAVVRVTQKPESKSAEDLGLHIPLEHVADDFKSPGEISQKPQENQELTGSDVTLVKWVQKMKDLNIFNDDFFARLARGRTNSPLPERTGNEAGEAPSPTKGSNHSQDTQMTRDEIPIGVITAANESFEDLTEYDDFSGEVDDVDGGDTDPLSSESRETMTDDQYDRKVQAVDDTNAVAQSADQAADHIQILPISDEYRDFSDEEEDRAPLVEEEIKQWRPSSRWEDVIQPDHIQRNPWLQNSNVIQDSVLHPPLEAYEDFLHYPQEYIPVSPYINYYQNDRNSDTSIDQYNHQWSQFVYPNSVDERSSQQQDFPMFDATSEVDLEAGDVVAQDIASFDASLLEEAEAESSPDLAQVTREVVSKALEKSRVELWRKSLSERYAKLAEGGQAIKAEGTTIPSLFLN